MELALCQALAIEKWAKQSHPFPLRASILTQEGKL